MNNLIHSINVFSILRHAASKISVEEVANIKIEHSISLRFSFKKRSTQMHPLHDETEYHILRIHEI